MSIFPYLFLHVVPSILPLNTTIITGHPELHNPHVLNDEEYTTRFWVTGKNDAMRSFTILLTQDTRIKSIVFCSDKLSHRNLDVKVDGSYCKGEMKNATFFELECYRKGKSLTFSSKSDIGLAEIFIIQEIYIL